MNLLMPDVGLEPVWMQRRRLALQCTSSLPTAFTVHTYAATSPNIAIYVILNCCATEGCQIKVSKEAQIVKIKGLPPSQYTPFIGFPIFVLTHSMNYNFASVVEATLVFTTIPEIYFMHLLMTDVGFEPVWMRRRRLALQNVRRPYLRQSQNTPFIGVPIFCYLHILYIFPQQWKRPSSLKRTGDIIRVSYIFTYTFYEL